MRTLQSKTVVFMASALVVLVILISCVPFRNVDERVVSVQGVEKPAGAELDAGSAGNSGQSTPTASKGNTGHIEAASATFPSSASPPQEVLTEPKAIVEFVKGPKFTYSRVKERLRPEVIPMLHKMLSDRTYLDAWSKLATAIAYLGGDAESGKVILDYVCRYDSWSDLDVERGRPLLVGKTTSLRLLGLMKSEENQKLLRRSATDEAYARSLIGRWISQPLPAWWKDGPQWFVVSLRSAAMDGLLLTNSAENIEFVRTSHRKLVANLRSAIKGNPDKDYSSDLWFYQESVGTMVRAKLLEELGYSEYLAHESDSKRLFEGASFYFSRIMDEDGIFDIGGPR